MYTDKKYKDISDSSIILRLWRKALIFHVKTREIRESVHSRKKNIWKFRELMNRPISYPGKNTNADMCNLANESDVTSELDVRKYVSVEECLVANTVQIIQKVRHFTSLIHIADTFCSTTACHRTPALNEYSMHNSWCYHRR